LDLCRQPDQSDQQNHVKPGPCTPGNLARKPEIVADRSVPDVVSAGGRKQRTLAWASHASAWCRRCFRSAHRCRRCSSCVSDPKPLSGVGWGMPADRLHRWTPEHTIGGWHGMISAEDLLPHLLDKLLRLGDQDSLVGDTATRILQERPCSYAHYTHGPMRAGDAIGTRVEGMLCRIRSHLRWACKPHSRLPRDTLRGCIGRQSDESFRPTVGSSALIVSRREKMSSCRFAQGARQSFARLRRSWKKRRANL